MKTMKALKPHRYKGKLRKTGEEYPVARADIRLLEALGHGIQVVPEEKPVVVPSRFYSYHTTSMEAEEAPKPAKRKYTRKAKVEE